jgi:hypothetical protein
MENIEITAIKGEVIGLQKHSKTKVYSTGGGGFVSQNGGYVASPQIRSNSTQINEFFVKTHEGKETHVKLTNIDVAMRDGHTITMIMAKNKNVKHGYWIAAVNHDTEKIHYLYSENNLLDMGVTKGSLKITSPSSLLMIGAIVAIVYVVTKTVEYLEIPVNEKFVPTTLLIMLVSYLAGLGYLSYKRKKADGLSRHEFLKKVEQCY